MMGLVYVILLGEIDLSDFFAIAEDSDMIPTCKHPRANKLL